MIIDVIRADGTPVRVNLHDGIEVVWYPKDGVLKVQQKGTQRLSKSFYELEVKQSLRV